MQKGDINSVVMLHYYNELMTLVHLKYYLGLALSGNIYSELLRGGTNTVEHETLLESLRLLCIDAIVRIDLVRRTSNGRRIKNCDWSNDGFPRCIRRDINHYQKKR